MALCLTTACDVDVIDLYNDMTIHTYCAARVGLLLHGFYLEVKEKYLQRVAMPSEHNKIIRLNFNTT